MIDTLKQYILCQNVMLRYLLIIFILGTLLRITPIIYMEIKTPGWHEQNINEIEFYYDDVARSLLIGKGFVHSVNPRIDNYKYKFEPGTPFNYVPPLYAWFLFIVYSVVGPSVFIAKLLQCIIDSAVIILLYLLGRKIFDNNRISLLAALLYSIYPLAIIMCSRLYYQIPMNLTLCWFIICFMSVPNIYNGIWSGIALGASSLAKPVTLPLIVVVPVVRLIEPIFGSKAYIQSLKWIVFFMLAVILTLTPWTIRNYKVFHEFVPVQKGANAPLLQGSREDYIDLDVESLRIKYGQSLGVNPKDYTKIAIDNHLTHLKNEPFDYLRFLGKKFILSWYNTEGKKKNSIVLLIQIPFLFFALVSLIFSGETWVAKSNWYVPAVILFICSVEVVFFPLARYTLVVMPFVMLMSAHGIYITWNRMSSKNKKLITFQ